MSSYGSTYRSTMCYPNFTTSKLVAISIFMRKNNFFFAFSLKFVTLNSPLLLLLNICKLSYLIGYSCPNLLRNLGPPHYLRTKNMPNQCPGRFLGIIGWDHRVSKSNRLLHVGSFRVSFTNSGYCSSDSSKMMGDFPEVLNLNQLSLKLNQFICSWRSVPLCSWDPIVVIKFSLFLHSHVLNHVHDCNKIFLKCGPHYLPYLVQSLPQCWY